MSKLKWLTDAEIEARLDGDPRIRKVRAIDCGLIGIVQSKVNEAWTVRFGPHDTGLYFAHNLAWADDPLPQAEPKESEGDIRAVLADRGQRYGSFDGHAELTQELKAAMAAHPNYSGLTASMRESLEMVQHKIGRIVNGDPTYLDSWVDIVGYTQLVIDELLSKGEQ